MQFLPINQVTFGPRCDEIPQFGVCRYRPRLVTLAVLDPHPFGVDVPAFDGADFTGTQAGIGGEADNQPPPVVRLRVRVFEFGVDDRVGHSAATGGALHVGHRVVAHPRVVDDGVGVEAGQMAVVGGTGPRRPVRVGHVGGDFLG